MRVWMLVRSPREPKVWKVKDVTKKEGSQEVRRDSVQSTGHGCRMLVTMAGRKGVCQASPFEELCLCVCVCLSVCVCSCHSVD